MLDADREKRLEGIFRRALDLPPERREAFLDAECRGDGELRARAAELLAEEAKGTSGILGRSLLREAPAGERRIGPYRLLEVLGEGGMGTVHLAEQTEPVSRRVALKTIRLGMASEEVLARFAGERQALAMLNHPNIAKIFDAGATESGLPWFAMEHCPGPPLGGYCDRARLPVEGRIGLLLPICEAVEHAHRRGVLHGDLKPGNVLVVQADGRPVPKVIDFGVAVALAGRSRAGLPLPSVGKAVGTWLYMSPEQADPNGDVDTRADVWALGAILYEILAGVPPFQAEEVSAIAAALKSQVPRPPSGRVLALPPPEARSVAEARRTTPAALARRLSGDLDAIAGKALERDVARRYDSPAELAADLRRHLRHEPVSARASTPSYRLARFVRRHRVAVSLGILACGALLAGLAAAFRGAQRARDGEFNRRMAAERRLDEGLAHRRFVRHRVFARGDLPISELLAGSDPAIALLFGSDPGQEAAVRFAVGVTWLDLDQTKEARRHLERADWLLTKKLGRNDVDSLLTLDALIRAARQSGTAPDDGLVRRSVDLAVTLASERDKTLGRDLGALAAMREGRAPPGTEVTARLRAVSEEFSRQPRRWEMAVCVGRVLIETTAGLLRQGRTEEAVEISETIERLAEEVFAPSDAERLLFFWRFAELHAAASPPLERRVEHLLSKVSSTPEEDLPADHWLRGRVKELEARMGRSGAGETRPR